MGRTACTEPQCLYMGALYLYFTLSSVDETGGSRYRLPGPGGPEWGQGPEYVACFCLSRYNRSIIQIDPFRPTHCSWQCDFVWICLAVPPLLGGGGGWERVVGGRNFFFTRALTRCRRSCPYQPTIMRNWLEFKSISADFVSHKWCACSMFVWPSIFIMKWCEMTAWCNKVISWCILSLTCFGLIRPWSGALDVKLQLMTLVINQLNA